MGKLEGKTALITGGNSGIGLATAKEFVSGGAYVFDTGRRERELAAAAGEVGRNVTGVQGDVASPGVLDRLFAPIKRGKGRLDIVFANAGVANSVPLGRLGTPAEVAKALVFLHLTTAATSRERNCSWMAAWPRHRQRRSRQPNWRHGVLGHSRNVIRCKEAFDPRYSLPNCFLRRG